MYFKGNNSEIIYVVEISCSGNDRELMICLWVFWWWTIQCFQWEKESISFVEVILFSWSTVHSFLVIQGFFVWVFLIVKTDSLTVLDCPKDTPLKVLLKIRADAILWVFLMVRMFLCGLSCWDILIVLKPDGQKDIYFSSRHSCWFKGFPSIDILADLKNPLFSWRVWWSAVFSNLR